MTSSLVTAAATELGSSFTAVLAPMTFLRVAVICVAGVAGLLFGSFLNVVVYRVPRGLSVVKPRSFCPHCDAPLRSIDNIPLVSWVVLGGRCRRCRGPISVRYPLVELATGVVFAAIGWGLGPHWSVAGACVLGATLVALTAIERDGMALPLSVAVIGTAIATPLLVVAAGVDRRWAHVVGVLIGVVVAAAVIATSGRRGDRSADFAPWKATAPMLLPVGAALGWLGPVYVGEGLAAAVVVAAAVRGAQRWRPSATPGSAGSVLGLALVAGVVVATVVAVAVGAGAGA